MPEIYATADLSTQHLASFDDILDVRSEAEFAEDRLPGAWNLPVLNNAERARIGTIYVQESSFLARRMGASIAARNIARFVETSLADKAKSWRPLIYCWRGGMRSRSLALILSEIGWRCALVDGGYKRWRRMVISDLEGGEERLPVVLLDGQTGAGKTRLLQAIADLGGQVIDLEGLASHRGSAFGALTSSPQPGQKLFETLIYDKISRFAPGRPIFVEAESRQVGRLRIPTRLWRSMETAERVEIDTPTDVRMLHILEIYSEMREHPAVLLEAIERLRPLHPRERTEHWLRLAAGGEHAALVRELIEHHYDPLYERLRAGAGPSRAGWRRVALPSLDQGDVASAARFLLATFEDRGRTCPPG